MSYDRGDSHYDSAGSWEKACRHIGLFLWWAAERGLGGAEVDVGGLRAGATQYFIDNCDTKLTDEDFNEEGQRFAAAGYDAYLEDVGNYAETLGVDTYAIPENEATRKHFFERLDLHLAAFRAGKPLATVPADVAPGSRRGVYLATALAVGAALLAWLLSH